VSASFSSAACQRVLGRVHTLHILARVHTLQPECTRFHNHVARGDVGFKAMESTVTFRLGASIMTLFVTGVGVPMMTCLPTLFKID
jgi:hypothetical protein